MVSTKGNKAYKSTTYANTKTRKYTINTTKIINKNIAATVCTTVIITQMYNYFLKNHDKK